MVEQLNSSGTATARYTQGLGIDEPMEVYEGGKSYYYHADGLGSIVALTKSTGTAANTYFGYNTFGGMPAPSETASNPFRFTAREFDSETGLYYYRARYYDSLFGRFLSEDPIGFHGGLNFYAYAKNSPVSFVDPSGEVIVVKGDYTAWLTALLYLDTSPAAYSIIKDLQDSPEVYTVNVSDTYKLDQELDNTVWWNPHKALCVKRGTQSAAIQLLHELAHLWQDEHHKSHNLEESATQMTNPAATQLGEPTRNGYSDAGADVTRALPIPGSASDKCRCQEADK